MKFDDFMTAISLVIKRPQVSDGIPLEKILDFWGKEEEMSIRQVYDKMLTENRDFRRFSDNGDLPWPERVREIMLSPFFSEKK